MVVCQISCCLSYRVVFAQTIHRHSTANMLDKKNQEKELTISEFLDKKL